MLPAEEFVIRERMILHRIQNAGGNFQLLIHAIARGAAPVSAYHEAGRQLYDLINEVDRLEFLFQQQGTSMLGSVLSDFLTTFFPSIKWDATFEEPKKLRSI